MDTKTESLYNKLKMLGKDVQVLRNLGIVYTEGEDKVVVRLNKDTTIFRSAQIILAGYSKEITILKITGESNLQELFLTDISDIEEIQLSLPNTHLTSGDSLFDNCKDLKRVKFLDFDTSKMISMFAMFSNCRKLTDPDIQNIDTSSCTSFESMFENCKVLGENGTIDLRNFNTSKVKSTIKMFMGCSRLRSIDVSTWDTSSLKSVSEMFFGCKSLFEADLSNWNMQCCSKLDWLFSECTGLRTVDITGWKTPMVFSLKGMFSNCNLLREIKGLNEISIDGVIRISNLFSNCEYLRDIDISNWKTRSGSGLYTTHLFYNCSSVRKIDMRNLTIESNSMGILNSCYELEELHVYSIRIVDRSAFTVQLFNDTMKLKTIVLYNTSLNEYERKKLKEDIRELLRTNIYDTNGLRLPDSTRVSMPSILFIDECIEK